MMRKKLLLLFSLCTMSLTIQAQATSYAGGDGTRENPYLISNTDEFAKMANDVAITPNISRGRYYKLTQDITFNTDVMKVATNKLSEGNAFPKSPMVGSVASETEYVAFQGTFDGDGHTINGYYQQESALYLAIFRVTEGATIKNLRINDSSIYGNANCGLIVGRAIDSRIINCSAVNSLLGGYGSYNGGLVGQAMGSTRIQNSYANVLIMCKNNAGGVVGRIGDGKAQQVLVENCYSVSDVQTSKTNRAGITSENAVGSTIRNCYFRPKSGRLTTAIWLDNGTSENVVSKSVDEFASAEFLTLLNETSQAIGGACRWQAGEAEPYANVAAPIHNYIEVTPDTNERIQEALATDPSPANKDFHAAADGGKVVLSWTLPLDGKTVSQQLFFGTDSTAVATSDAPLATLALDNSYTVQDLNVQKVYYWRVDRIDANGQSAKGDVWHFQPRHLAFRGAEGYGRFSRGGRGGKVVYVTNLNDSGEGSLRWALTNGSGPRTVLFKVSGIIDMNFRACWSDPQVTIAGQSAPDKGICLKHCDIGIGSDNIVRHLRARRGLGTSEETGNAIGTVYADHTILDHVTASWGTDETFSSRSSRNITFQRSMISEALGIAGHRNYDAGTNHGYAATIGGDIGTFSHNLLADCTGRNWSMGGGTNAAGEYAGRLDIFNNVVYNWKTRTTDGGAHEVNFVGNYYKMGPAGGITNIFTLDIEGNLKGTQSAYISGNIRENMNGSLTQDKEGETYCLRIRDGRTSLDWQHFVDKPFFESFAKIETAQEAYKSVLSDVGANQPMSDLTDQRIFRETLERTYTYVGSKSKIKGQIDNEEDAGGFEEYPATAWSDDFDSDLDGLPDWWEAIYGTNAHSAADDFSDSNADPDGDGYTALEDYLEFVAQPHVYVMPGATAEVSVADLFRGYTKSPVYNVESSNTVSIASLADGVLTVKGMDTNGVEELILKVTDAEGSSYERPLYVAVTSNAAVTAINTPCSTVNVQRSLVIYNLQGQRMNSLRKGLNIVNGTKVVIK